jgi:phospholipid/cholesterol/gamma-HCH transport system substrate-binding protein
MAGRPERNHPLVGGVGLAVVLVLVLLAFNAESLPLIGGGTRYSAAFTEAAGLRPDDEVRVAGVKVGEVSGVDLDGDHVKVSFRVKDAWLGDWTTAAIRIKTLLGRKYLALDSDGTRQLRRGAEIPLDRTAVPYDVVEAFSGLTDTIDQIDTGQLARAFDTLATTFRDTPEEVRSAVRGLSALSRTIHSRDVELRELLSRTRGVTAVLAERNTEFTRLISDSTLLLAEVRARRAVISALLRNTSELSIQLSGLVRDNEARLGPSLEQLAGVVAVLRENQDNLDRSIALLAPFVRVFTNTLGNGRWFDTYVQNLTEPRPVPIPGGTP